MGIEAFTGTLPLASPGFPGFPEVGQQLLHALVLGFILMGVTWISCRRAPHSADDEEETVVESAMHAANALFLCFGMAGVMILVNNSLARAFAIGAAIALVRFRVKVDHRGLAMSLLYAMIVGMACGVGQVALGWLMGGVFALLQVVVLAIYTWTVKVRPPQHLRIVEKSREEKPAA